MIASDNIAALTAKQKGAAAWFRTWAAVKTNSCTGGKHYDFRSNTCVT
jgi:hypothetical protein